MLFTLQYTNFNFQVDIILSFANALNLDYQLFLILSFGKDIFCMKKKGPFCFQNVPKLLQAMRHLSQTFFNPTRTLGYPFIKSVLITKMENFSEVHVPVLHTISFPCRWLLSNINIADGQQ